MQISVVEEILFANKALASDLRQRLDDANVFGINVMASPGAGKTTVITGTVERLRDRLRIGYVDGDIATSYDAERVAALQVPSVQINTGGNCHLDANMVAPALDQLPLDEIDLMIVENIGNLICPANFPIGSHISVLVASVPEGDDKPYKYPGMFSGVDVVILNKIDLLPYIPFDRERFIHGVRVLNPDMEIFEMSALNGTGMDQWTDWLAEKAASSK